MTHGIIEEPSDQVVGAERDPEGIARSLLTGTSIVVVGSLGSGKSHLLRAVTSELVRRGADPLVLRTARVLSRVEFGALDDAHDPRSDALKDTATDSDDPPTVVVVDDVQDLDRPSSEALVRAIHRRRAVALVGLSAPRARGARDSEVAATVFVDLWLHGRAERVDLRELSAGDADDLLDLHFPANRFDSVTRATIIGLADGSRILLRELAAHADTEIARARDPLSAFRDIHRHSRLGDALAAHTAEFDEPERTALALLGHLPGIDHADATRLIPASMIEALLSAKLLQEDGTIRRRIYANAALAQACTQQLDAGVVEWTMERAAARMLEGGGTWWSAPLASAIAARWHGDDAAHPTRAETPPALRERVARDAARDANDRGMPALALAYIALVDEENTSAECIALERAYAEVILTRSPAPLTAVDPARLDDGGLGRYLLLRTLVGSPRNMAQLRGIVAEGTSRAHRLLRAELELAAAEASALEIDWAGAGEAAARAAAMAEPNSTTRVRALLSEAMATMHTGDWSRAEVLLEEVDGILLLPASTDTPGVAERILALCVEMVITMLAGVEPVRVRERLRDQTIAAAREANGRGIFLAGIAAALLHARQGDTDSALSELEACHRRATHMMIGPGVWLMHLVVARAISLLGRTADARVLLRRASEAITVASPLVDHDRHLTAATISAAEGDVDTAVAEARAAAELSARNEGIIHLRDLYLLAALDAAQEPEVERMHRIADASGLTSAILLADRAAAMVRGRKSSPAARPSNGCASACRGAIRITPVRTPRSAPRTRPPPSRPGPVRPPAPAPRSRRSSDSG
ncbi:hypothetical protein [Microbacterium sp. CJ88]|uniref:hypothetical protein n=1 Tax=Microbacterium sp. CJ88 TaxID=3445672 RepID=UPI003F65E0E1